MFSNNDVIFWTRYLKTGTATVSEGNAKIYGLTRKDFEKNPDLWMDFIHPDDSAVLLDAIQNKSPVKKRK
ncbi:PAS domain-containing protein [Virgibacillus sp. L01]